MLGRGSGRHRLSLWKRIRGFRMEVRWEGHTVRRTVCSYTPQKPSCLAYWALCKGLKTTSDFLWLHLLCNLPSWDWFLFTFYSGYFCPQSLFSFYSPTVPFLMATSPPRVENAWLQPPPEMSLRVYSRRGQSRTTTGFMLQNKSFCGTSRLLRSLVWMHTQI